MAREDATIRTRMRASGASALAVPSATAQALESTGLTTGRDLHELPNLVLVVVESWGLAADPSLNGALVEPYFQPELLDQYDVLQGTVPFKGATVAGEARELCGSSFGYHLLNAASTELQGCLPARLAKLGYHDIAVHGLSGYMFSRSAWYGTIGFQEQWFNDRLKQQGLPDCLGAFIGTCDAAITGWIGTRLEKEDAAPYFIHWMTLNSHLPVPVPAQLPTGAPCSRDLLLSPETPLCSWYQLVANVHQSVSQLAMGRLARPTVFVIVGDHAPPFANPALRNRFSGAVVPYVVLMPRAMYHAPGRMTAQNSLSPDRDVAKSSRQTP
jgi:phosphoglycerol transferase MdoB-like AlkP superfamily enzyme